MYCAAEYVDALLVITLCVCVSVQGAGVHVCEEESSCVLCILVSIQRPITGPSYIPNTYALYMTDVFSIPQCCVLCYIHSAGLLSGAKVRLLLY